MTKALRKAIMKHSELATKYKIKSIEEYNNYKKQRNFDITNTTLHKSFGKQSNHC